MLHTLRSALRCLPLLLAACSALAQTDAGTTEQLLRKSGFWQQMAEVPAQVRNGMLAATERDPAADAAATQRLLQAVDTAYAVPKMQAVALATVSKGLDPKYVPALLAWLDSPAGVNIRKLEEASSADASGPEAIVRDGTALLEAAPSTRRALIRQIVEVTKSAELLTDLTVNTTLAVQQGAASVHPDRPAPSPAELRAAANAQRPRMLQLFETLSLAGSAKTYASVPGEELSAYAALLNSDAGRHFSDLCALALNAALVDASQALGRGLVVARDAKGS